METGAQPDSSERTGASARAAPVMGGPVPVLAPRTAPGAAPRRMLAVDDEPELADLAAALLNGFGIEASVAYGAVEALAILHADPLIDAVFSDVMMPGMTGLELAEVIRGLFPSLKIVLTSGFIHPALIAEHGRPYLFVPKPYSIETVMALLRA